MVRIFAPNGGSYDGGAGACVRQVVRQSSQLLAAARSTRTVQWVLDEPQDYTTAEIPGGVDNSVLLPLLGYDPSIPIVPPAVLPVITDVETILTIDPGFSAQVTVNHNIRYETATNAGLGAKSVPTWYQAAPFLIEVQDMVVDPEDTALLIADTSVAPLLYLLPYASFNLPGATYLLNTGERLLLGPYVPAHDQPRYVRLRLLWYLQGPGLSGGTDPADWNQTAPDQGGWAVSPYVDPFPGLLLGAVGSLPVALPRPPDLEFDIRFGNA